MPPTFVAVPLKYFDTRSSARPTASKICAPVYDMYVEMPIFDMTFSRPLPTAFVKL